MTHVDDATFALLLNSTRLPCWFCHVKGHDVKGHNVKGHNVKGHDVIGHAGVERTIVLLAGEFMRWRWEAGGGGATAGVFWACRDESNILQGTCHMKRQ